MRIEISKNSEKALEILHNAGHEAYIVGGSVRDALLGLTPGDYDITTSATPEETEKAFEGYRFIETGLKHGTVTVLIAHEPIEITTFRTETTYADGRHPDTVSFTRSLSEDLIRRDLTVNAIAYSHETGVIDICGGLADIEAKLIRAVGDPYERFHEDGLRVLRALRFASVYGFGIETITARAIHDSAEMLEKISPERIFVELKKLLCGKNVFSVLTEFSDIICKIIPELSPSVGFEQNNPHHIYDVYTHTAKAVELSPNNVTVRLAALLHDAGKPETYSEKNGIGHFYGHSEASMRVAEAVLLRLRSDTKTLKRVLTLIKHHDPVITVEEKAVRKKMRILTPEVLNELLDLKSADNLAQSPDCAVRLSEYAEIRKIMEKLIAENACFSLRDLKINGDDLKAIGIPEGKKIGITLKFLFEAVESGDLPNDREALIAKARKM